MRGISARKLRFLCLTIKTILNHWLPIYSSLKIKFCLKQYACRKTLADSRPRVRGRFAKNDEFCEPNRQASSSHHEEDNDDDVRSIMFSYS